MQDETVRFHLFCAQVVHRDQSVTLLQGIVPQTYSFSEDLWFTWKANGLPWHG